VNDLATKRTKNTKHGRKNGNGLEELRL